MAVARVTEVVASSDKSFEDAITQGIERAARTLRGMTGAHSVVGPYAVTFTTAGGTFIGQKATYT